LTPVWRDFRFASTGGAGRVDRMQMIKDLAEKDNIAFKKHSILRMYERNIIADEVKEILISGEIIESYLEDRPLPSCLILGYTTKQRPIHVVVSVDKKDQMLWVITVYIPSLEEWEKGFRRRKT